MVADLGARVLIADSDPALRQRLYSRLLELDVFSDCVAKVRDALEKLDGTLYTVAIIDLALPPDGMQVLDRIARMPAQERPVVLVLAAHPDAARALDVEIVQIVLRKPVDVKQLADLSRSCIRTAVARRNAQPPSPPADHVTS